MFKNIIRKISKVFNVNELQSLSDIKKQKRGGKGKNTLPIITLCTTATLSFSSPFNNRAQIDKQKFNYVKLSFSETQNAIILDLFKEKPAYGLTSYSKITRLDNGWATIACKTFLNHFNIDYSIVQRYKPVQETFTDGSKKWVIYLNK